MVDVVLDCVLDDVEQDQLIVLPVQLEVIVHFVGPSDVHVQGMSHDLLCEGFDNVLDLELGTGVLELVADVLVLVDLHPDNLAAVVEPKGLR